MKEDQEQTPAEKEERRHAEVVRRIMEDRDKRKTPVSSPVCVSVHECTQKRGKAEEEEKTVVGK